MPVTRERGEVVGTAENLLHIATEEGWLIALSENVLWQRDLVREQSRRSDIYDRMRFRNPAISGAYDKLMLPILSAEPSVVPPHGDETPKALRRAQDMTEELRRGCGFTDILRGVLEFPWRGYGGVELIGKRGGFGDPKKGEPLLVGAISLPGLAIRFSPKGQPRLRLTGAEWEGVPLDVAKWRWKFIVGAWGSRAGGNWYGQGIAQAVYWLWVFGTQNMKSWTQALEKYASPALKAKYLGKDFVGNQDRMLEILRDFTAQGHLLEPADWDITMLGGPSARSFPGYEKHAEVIEGAIVKAIVGSTLTTDTQGVGSQALGSVHADQLTERQKGFVKWAGGLLSDTLIPSMEEAMFGKTFGNRLELGFEEREDQEANRANLTTAAELGLEAKTEQVYRLLGLDQPRKDMEPTMVLSKAPLAGGLGMPAVGGDGAGLALFAESNTAGLVDARNENRRLDALEGASVGAAAAAAKAMSAALAEDIAKGVGRSARKKQEADRS